MDSSDVPELSEGIQASIERGLDCFWRWPTCMQRLFPFHVVTHSAALFLLRESHRLFSRILPSRESTGLFNPEANNTSSSSAHQLCTEIPQQLAVLLWHVVAHLVLERAGFASLFVEM